MWLKASRLILFDNAGWNLVSATFLARSSNSYAVEQSSLRYGKRSYCKPIDLMNIQRIPTSVVRTRVCAGARIDATALDLET